MSDSRWAEAAAFDDDTLAALASPGLVRRAKKLLGEAPLAMRTGGREDAVGDEIIVTIGADDVVFMPGDGVANGRCSCPTVGPCQHLLAAIMTLRDDATSGDDVATTSRSDTARQSGLVLALLAIGDDELVGFAGRDALRWALARVDEIADVDVVDGASCVVRPVPGIEVHFMAPALTSAFCSPPSPHDRRNIALAIVAIRAQHGVDLPRVEPSDTGPTDQAASAGSLIVGQVVRAAVDTVADAIGIGIAHPSTSTRDRFELISDQARAVGLHRIALLAARLHRHYEEAVSLHATADPMQLLGDLALLHVVAELSVSRLDEGELPRWLRGVAQTDYSPVPPFEALGLGAIPWVDRSGYAGMTGVLFDLANERFVEVTTAQQSASIDTASQWKEPIGWRSETSLSTLSGKRFQIAGALISPGLRLSPSAKTSIETLGTWSPSQLKVCEWDGVAPQATSRLHGRSSARWTVAVVEAAGASWFDEINQRLVWPIRSHGRNLEVTLSWQPHHETAVKALERLTTLQVSHVIGLLTTTATAGFAMTPASIIVDKRLYVLAVDDTASRARVGRPRPKPAMGKGWRSSPASAALDALGARILRLAERGIDTATDRDFDLLSQRAGDFGYMSVARVLSSGQRDHRARVLLAAHLVEEHRAFIDDDPGQRR